MNILFLLLSLPAAGHALTAAPPASTPREVPRIAVPNAPLGGAPLILTPGPIIITSPSKLILPQAPVVIAAPTLIVPASRALTEEEAAKTDLPAQEELKKLVEDLSPQAETAQDLGRTFDGSVEDEDSSAPDTSYFANGPRAPGLGEVESAARSVMARFLPRFYRPIPAASAYASGDKPSTGHTWTPGAGHLIEIEPVPADSKGEVPSAFGLPGAVRVQQKIERFMLYSHEFAHVLFDAAVRKTENHSPHSAYAAMTEGFAVAVERLLVERMLARPAQSGLSSRDALDLVALSRGRSHWLAATDTHYSEGSLAWRKAYERGGQAGMLTLLSTLSARRMTAVMRADPAYQLSLGEPALLSAYLGRNADSPARRGLEAYAASARGEKLSQEELSAAAAVVEKAGPEGWRRLFERSLLEDKNLAQPALAQARSDWWNREKPKAPVNVEPAFAAARLSPGAAAALADYLLEIAQLPGGAKRLFERPGPNPKLAAIVAGAETLPWREAARQAWMQALTSWLSLA